MHTSESLRLHLSDCPGRIAKQALICRTELSQMQMGSIIESSGRLWKRHLGRTAVELSQSLGTVWISEDKEI